MQKLNTDMKTIKELRNALNMSISRFSEFTAIPYRSIQNWELEISECPAYVLSLLNEQIRPYIESDLYAYKRYTWMANVGTDYDMEEKVFLTKDAAITYAIVYWNHLTDSEKENHHAYIGMCEIDLTDLTPDTSNGIFYLEYMHD